MSMLGKLIIDIEGMGFDLVIADESHKLQGIRSKVSVGLAKCCRRYTI